MMQLEAQLTDKQVELVLSDEACDWLAERGYDANYGARPLGRVVQEHIKKPLADELLFGELSDGGMVHVSVEDDKLKLEFTPNKQKQKKPEKV